MEENKTCNFLEEEIKLLNNENEKLRNENEKKKELLELIDSVMNECVSLDNV